MIKIRKHPTNVHIEIFIVLQDIIYITLVHKNTSEVQSEVIL